MNLTDNYLIDLNRLFQSYTSVIIKPQMGTILICNEKINWELKEQMEKDRTGSIIRFQGEQKEKFIQQIAESPFKKNKIHRLQPQLSNQHKGFLYKVGIFFYEGHISGYSNMDQYGRLLLLPRKIQYQGSFKDNQLHGTGVLQNKQRSVILQGKWEKGFPKELVIQDNSNQHRIQLKSLGEQPKEFPNLIAGTVIYADKRSYHGIFAYDRVRKEYTLTGDGKLIYANGDSLEGTFTDGNLNGQGLFVSSRGTYNGEFKDGKFQGKGQFCYIDGRKLTISWSNNKPQGRGTLTRGKSDHVVFYQEGKRVPTPTPTQNC